MDTQIENAKMEKIVKPIIASTSIGNIDMKKSYSPILMTQADPEQPAENISATEEETKDATDLIPNDPYLTSPMFHELAQFLNVEPKFYEAQKDKISVITDWAILKTGSNKIEDIFSTIRSLENNLYSPESFETRINHIYKYVRLASKRDAFNKALRAYEKVKGEN